MRSSNSLCTPHVNFPAEEASAYITEALIQGGERITSTFALISRKNPRTWNSTGSGRLRREYWFYEGLSTHLRLCGYIWFGECDIQFIHTHEFLLAFLKVPTKVKE